MYRRDISSVLKLLGLGLVLFVGYQVWLKPAVLPPTQKIEPPASTAPLPGSLTLSLSEPSASQLWDVPPSRLVELGPAPNQTLSSIRDELDRGQYSEVARRLAPLSQKKLTSAPTRRYIAALWNNLGVQQEKFGGTALSVNSFKRSVAWDPKNRLGHLNLTQAYWELRDPAMTVEFLETVVRLAPQDPFPHLALADLLLTNGKPVLAATHLAQARPRAERDPNHQVYLRKLAAKVEALKPVATAKSEAVQPPQAPRLEVAKASSPSVVQSPAPSPELTQRVGTTDVAVAKKAPIPEPKQRAGTTDAAPPKNAPRLESTQPSAEHFTVQFDGPPEEATWIRMRAILNYAFEELSQKYGHVPSKPIPVVLHTNLKFIGEGGSPAWADSLLEESSGTIHLPTQGALEDLGQFSRVARHEFIHALILAHAKGLGTQVPHWLIEGLAIHLAEDPWSDLDGAGHKTGAMIPLTSLQGSWKQLPRDAVQIAYLEARSATQLLIDSYGVYGVQQVLNAMRTGRSLDAAMQQKLSVSYDQFHRQWEKNFKLSTKPRDS